MAGLDEQLEAARAGAATVPEGLPRMAGMAQQMANVLRAAAEAGADRLVMMSSLAVCETWPDNPVPRPTRRWQ